MRLLGSASYQQLAGEFGLINPLPQPTDEIVAKICERFVGSSAAGRDLMRASVSEEDFYTLMDFGERCAVFALRRSDPKMIELGLSAVAMVEGGIYDFRDFRYEHLPAAAMFLGLNVDDLMSRAIAMGEPKTIEAMSYYSQVGKAALQRIVKTKFGTGFLSPFSRISKEILAMLPIGIEIAEFIERGGRYIAKIEGDETVPVIWFQNQAATNHLASAKGVICVKSNLAPNVLPELAPLMRSATWLNIWVVEFGDAQIAQTMSKLANDGTWNDTVVSGTAVDNLFALIVARTSVEEASPVESRDSINNIARGIEKKLQHC